MIGLGVIWALIGYAVCEMTNRGRVTTTVVTAVAGALGLGGGLAHQLSATAAPVAGLAVAAGVVLLVALGVVFVLYRASWTGRGGRHKHGSAAIASTRYVTHTERPGEPVHQGKARPDRIWLHRAGE